MNTGWFHGRLRVIIATAMMLLFLWAAIGDLVFAFRHPWLTDAQRMFHLWDAMTFQRISEPVKDANDA